MARPIPRLPPVTKAYLFISSLNLYTVLFLHIQYPFPRLPNMCAMMSSKLQAPRADSETDRSSEVLAQESRAKGLYCTVLRSPFLLSKHNLEVHQYNCSKWQAYSYGLCLWFPIFQETSVPPSADIASIFSSLNQNTLLLSCRQACQTTC